MNEKNKGTLTEKNKSCSSVERDEQSKRTQINYEMTLYALDTLKTLALMVNSSCD